MGILDGIVAWIAEQVMNGLDLITTSVLGALGCDMSVFLRYFPAAETMYQVFVALGVGLSRTARGLSNLGLFQRLCGQHPLPLLCRGRKCPKTDGWHLSVYKGQKKRRDSGAFSFHHLIGCRKASRLTALLQGRPSIKYQ